MKRRLLLFLSIFSFFIISSQTIVIDPGHGFCNDCSQSCSPSGIRSETEIYTAMSVSNKLKNLFSNCSNVNTYLTRQSSNCGDMPSISARRILSNDLNADRYLSVHCNAGGGDGTETFYCELGNASLNKNIEFSNEIQEQMVKYGDWKDRRVAEYNTYLNRGHLGVLNGNNAIGCLNEIGFVDTNSNKVKLEDDSWRNEFAKAYYIAIKNSLSISCSSSSTNPDLVIERMWTVPENPTIGQDVDLYVEFKNVGGQTANSISLDYKIDNTKVGSDTHTSLEPNETRTEYYNNYVFSNDGSFNYCVFIDAVSNEQNTSNNSYCTTVTIGNSSGGSEDIFLTNVSLSTTTVSAGEEITAYATMNYSGNQLDTNLPSFDLDYFLSTDCTLSNDDVLLGGDISGLGSDDPTINETQELTIPVSTSSGTYYILFVADADGELNESNENNNIECIQITVNNVSNGSEDIFLTNVSVSSTTVNAGGEITAYATMNYSGSQLDTNLPSFDLDYYLSTDCNLSNDDIFLDDDASGLGSDDPTQNESQILIIPTNTSSGTYYILFVADADNELNESNENNNIECIQITVNNTLSTVDNELQKQLSIYPNPSSEIVNIKKLENTLITHLIIYDLKGSVVKKEKGNDLRKVDISNLKQGIYLLKVISSENKKATFRILKR